MGRGIPNCVLEARPLCEEFPQLLHEITLSGIKPPHHELILSYMPSRQSGKVTSYLNFSIKQASYDGLSKACMVISPLSVPIIVYVYILTIV